MKTNSSIRFNRNGQETTLNIELDKLEHLIDTNSITEQELQDALSLKQNILADGNDGLPSLNTTDKTIVGAINELESRPALPNVDNETIFIRDRSGVDVLVAEAITDGTTTIDVEDILEQKSAIEDLALRLDSIDGRGIPLPANDFGENIPESDDLDSYALQILNDWGVLNDSIDSKDIPHGTYVVNTFNNHKWVLINLPTAIPPLYRWIDDGSAFASTASNYSLGVVKGSDQELDVSVRYDGSMYINGLQDSLTDINNSISEIRTDVNSLYDRVDNIDNSIIQLQDDLQNKVDKTNEIEVVYGTNENGEQALYAISTFGKVDDVQVNGVSVVENKVANIVIDYLPAFIEEIY